VSPSEDLHGPPKVAGVDVFAIGFLVSNVLLFPLVVEESNAVREPRLLCLINGLTGTSSSSSHPSSWRSCR